MLSFLKRFADVADPKSASNRFRIKRFKHFRDFIDGLPRPVRILDIGGTQIFWEMMGLTSTHDVDVTIFNKEQASVTLPNFRMIPGRTEDLAQFSDCQFDIVFSNSVIEHLGSFEKQSQMASEIMRIGKRYFVQTPNFYFPLEPHFLFPFFQFLPLRLKILMLTHFSLGWYEKQSSHNEAMEIANSVKLLRLRKIKLLFPGSVIIKEKFLLLTKSFLIISPN